MLLDMLFLSRKCTYASHKNRDRSRDSMELNLILTTPRVLSASLTESKDVTLLRGLINTSAFSRNPEQILDSPTTRSFSNAEQPPVGDCCIQTDVWSDRISDDKMNKRHKQTWTRLLRPFIILYEYHSNYGVIQSCDTPWPCYSHKLNVI